MHLFRKKNQSSIILVFLLCISAIRPAASQSFHISGNISDLITKTPIENAKITLSDPSNEEVYASGILSDAQGDYQTDLTMGANGISREMALSQSNYAITGTFPNPIPPDANLNVYYNCPDNSLPDPVIELYDIKGTRIGVRDKLAPGWYSLRLDYQNGIKSNIRKLMVTDGGYVKFHLIKNISLQESGHKKSIRSLLDVKFTIEKPGYVTIEEEKSINSDADNTFDWNLTAFESVLSPAMRIEILDSIESKLNQLEEMDTETRDQTMLEYLNGISEIQDVEMDDNGSFWASFTDGKLIYIASSLYPEVGDTLTKSIGYNPVKSNASDLPVSFSAMEPENIEVAGSGMLPASKSFLLLNGMSSYYKSTDPLPKIKAILESRGYTGVQGTATLEILRNVHGFGIFYYRGHGDVSPLGGNRDIYALWTQSEVDETSEAEDTTLSGDLAAHRIVYMLFKDSGLASLSKKWWDRHYGITHLFINHYMTFAPNALVYIDACSSSSRVSFRNAFKNASLFIGWDNLAQYSNILSSSQYVFDRLLGANIFDKPDPLQRPFDYSALSSDPDFGPGQKYGYSQHPRFIANLGFFHLRDDFAMLAPSIKNLEIDEVNETMEINGKFGPDPGDGNRTVIIGNRNVGINNWTDDKILVELKPEDEGDVVLKINEIESNKVPLTNWRGAFAYTYMSFNPTLSQKVNFNLHFRGDVHPYRDLPGYPVQYANIPVIPARDSDGNWNYSGREDDGDGCGFTEITGEGSLDWVEPGNEAEWHGGDCEKSAQYVFWGTIDPNLKQLACNLVFWVCGKFTFAYQDANQNCVIQSVDDPLYTHPDYLLAPLYLDFDDQFNLPDGSRGEINDDFDVQLVWKDFVTTAPPNDKTPSK